MSIRMIDLTSILGVLPPVVSNADVVRADGKDLSEPQTVLADTMELLPQFLPPKLQSFGPCASALSTANRVTYRDYGTAFGLANLPVITSTGDKNSIASVIDIEACWDENCAQTTIDTPDQSYMAMVLGNVELYAVEVEALGWLSDPLIRVRLADSNSLWLMMTPEPASDIDLACRAFTLARAGRQRTVHFGTHIVLPCTRLGHKPDISWLSGLTFNGEKAYEIEHAVQQIDVSLSEVGSNALKSTNKPDGTPFIVDKPFMGYFTTDQDASASAKTSPPIAPFYADFQSWLTA